MTMQSRTSEETPYRNRDRPHLDGLAGRKESSGEMRIHNHALYRHHQHADRLSDEEQRALIAPRDRLTKRAPIDRVIGAKRVPPHAAANSNAGPAA